MVCAPSKDACTFGKNHPRFRAKNSELVILLPLTGLTNCTCFFVFWLNTVDELRNVLAIPNEHHDDSGIYHLEFQQVWRWSSPGSARDTRSEHDLSSVSCASCCFHQCV